MCLGGVACWVGAARLPREGGSSSGGVECTDYVELGPNQIGTMRQASFKIANRNTHNVQLLKTLSDCACVDVYRLNNGVKIKIQDYVLQPNEEVTLHADIRIGGEPGQFRSSTVIVQTSETGFENLVTRINYLPVTRLYTLPRAALFGELLEGQEGEQAVELVSDGTYTDRIEAITCSNPLLYHVTYYPINTANSGNTKHIPKGQMHVGTIKVTARATSGPMVDNDTLVVYSNGKELISFPVSCSVVREQELRPGNVVLPRVAAKELVYSINVICKSNTKKPYRLKYTSENLPFDVRFQNNDHGDHNRLICIVYTGSKSNLKVQNYELAFAVESEQQVKEIRLPVCIDITEW